MLATTISAWPSLSTSAMAGYSVQVAFECSVDSSFTAPSGPLNTTAGLIGVDGLSDAVALKVEH
ncbi:MAG: hypothetical protein IPI35_32720 [Deltaproteobacteria bacterium]|nr:hypothetical protein [Deltaproteobacteria bacterium]